MATLVNESVDIEKAIKAEEAIAPGLVEVRFYTSEPLTKQDAQEVYDHLWENHIDVKQVSIKSGSGLPYLSVIYDKPAPHEGISQILPMAIIPLIAFGMIAVLVGIGIFNIQSITQNVGKLLLITFGGVVLVGLAFRKPIESVATAYAKR